MTDTPPNTPADAMTAQERDILECEKMNFTVPGQKAQYITDHFEISPARYYHILNRLLDKPEALMAEPVLVHRLLEKRDT